jgi:hypothetical protein
MYTYIRLYIGIDQWNFILSPENASQDVTGDYTRKWCPELSGLSNKCLHTPWKATAQELAAAGVEFGVTYPHRIVADLAAERQASVEAVLEMRRLAPEFNDAGGYDSIQLPGGQTTRVFTKQEFRLDVAGHVKPPPPHRTAGTGGGGRGRGKGRRGGGGGGSPGTGGGRGRGGGRMQDIRSFCSPGGSGGGKGGGGGV